ncbi:phage tail protein I [Teredinibacter franksiae]|uniref:phage tail protein I n=1 Tax=Teredinibacter franksiae TaxID=2761453 RepID=UPI001626FA3E|nr:phage tail protein I [Teredinibacter franksiae]
MNPVNDLLPPNAAPLERKLSQATAVLENVDVPLTHLWDAETCPEEFLPWLAWGVVVDRWDETWPVGLKRAIIKYSSYAHKIRGTRKAVCDAIRMELALADMRVNNVPLEDIHNLERYGGSFQVKEWWHKSEQEGSNPSRGKAESSALTFSIQLLIGGDILGGRGLLGGDLYRRLRDAVDAVKPLSTQYTLSIGGAKLDAQLPQYRPSLRLKKYHRFQVLPKVSLKLHAQLGLTTSTRSIEQRRFSMRPLPKLQLTSTLKLQPGVRNIRMKNFVLKPKD